MSRLSTPILSDDHVNDFERNGYLVVRGAFGATEMSTIDSWCREVLAMREESGKHWVYHEESLTEPGRDLISRVENVAPFHAGFSELTEVLKAPVGQLLGDEAILFKEKINFKMPGGDGFRPHQDSQAGWDDYAEFFISVLLSIDAATEENGCIQIAGGHHRRGLFRSGEPLTEEDMAGMEFIPSPTRPGDLIFFDCYAPHASEANASNTIRRIYYATYNRLSAGDHLARYYADKHKSYPPDIDREPDKEYVFRV